jgi:hypothetical protein
VKHTVTRPFIGTGEFYGTTFLAEIVPAAEHPGYCHCAVMCLADSHLDETKRPVRDDLVVMQIDMFLEPHGLKFHELVWRIAEPDELVLFPLRAQDIGTISHEE